MHKPNSKLVVLFQKMAELTLPQCQHKCNLPLSCCSAEYCEEAKRYAKEDWGIDLQFTEHPELPFMGEKGCIVPPHLRPLCTLHVCKINAVGTTGDAKWDKEYYSLREKIDNLL